jgi:hypothetical protein
LRSKKIKILNPDKIVKITFRDEKIRKHEPIFNFEDENVKSVFAGINEIVPIAIIAGGVILERLLSCWIVRKQTTLS